MKNLPNVTSHFIRVWPRREAHQENQRARKFQPQTRNESQTASNKPYLAFYTRWEEPLSL